MLRLPRSLLSLFVFALVFAFAGALQAQVQVDLKITRRLFVAYEPIVATVSITNLAGRDLPLMDKNGQSWFSFEILRANGQPIPPLDADARFSPILVPPGRTVQRKVVLNRLYPVTDFGLYRIRASIYFGPFDRFYQSAQRTFEISEGRTIWRQVVGVPEGEKGAGENRRYSLMTFRHPAANYLYIRVENTEQGLVYCTTSLGKVLAGADPEVRLDGHNHLHILQLDGAKLFLHSEIGLNGELLGQEHYLAVTTRPTLRSNRTGVVTILGGQLQTNQPQENPLTNPDVPKLSDRPVTLPGG